MLTELIEAINAIRAGQVAGIGALLMVLVRAYRMIPGAPWPSKRWGWAVGLSLALLGGVAAMLTGAALGMGWGPAALAGVGVAVNAIGLHEATAAIGRAVRAPQDPAANRSAFGAAASIVLPAPKIGPLRMTAEGWAIRKDEELRRDGPVDG